MKENNFKFFLMAISLVIFSCGDKKDDKKSDTVFQIPTSIDMSAPAEKPLDPTDEVQMTELFETSKGPDASFLVLNPRPDESTEDRQRRERKTAKASQVTKDFAKRLAARCQLSQPKREVSAQVPLEVGQRISVQLSEGFNGNNCPAKYWYQQNVSVAITRVSDANRKSYSVAGTVNSTNLDSLEDSDEQNRFGLLHSSLDMRGPIYVDYEDGNLANAYREASFQGEIKKSEGSLIKVSGSLVALERKESKIQHGRAMIKLVFPNEAVVEITLLTESGRLTRVYVNGRARPVKDFEDLFNL